MRSTCYEIGGDVFSLAELQGLLRAKLSKPTVAKYPYLTTKTGRYTMYSPVLVDPRLHFVLVSFQMQFTAVVKTIEAHSSLVIRIPETLHVLSSFQC